MKVHRALKPWSISKGVSEKARMVLKHPGMQLIDLQANPHLDIAIFEHGKIRVAHVEDTEATRPFMASRMDQNSINEILKG